MPRGRKQDRAGYHRDRTPRDAHRTHLVLEGDGPHGKLRARGAALVRPHGVEILVWLQLKLEFRQRLTRGRRASAFTRARASFRGSTARGADLARDRACHVVIGRAVKELAHLHLRPVAWLSQRLGALGRAHGLDGLSAVSRRCASRAHLGRISPVRARAARVASASTDGSRLNARPAPMSTRRARRGRHRRHRAIASARACPPHPAACRATPRPPPAPRTSSARRAAR